MYRNTKATIYFFFFIIAWHLAYATPSIPFVDCGGGLSTTAPSADGSLDATLPPKIASKLAYFVSYGDVVLAPREWHCETDNGVTGGSVTVYPKHSKYPIYGAYSASFGNTPLSAQAYIYDWAKRYFPKLIPSDPDVKDFGPIVAVPKYSRDLLRYHNQYLLTYFTPRLTDGVGLQLLSSALNVPSLPSKQSVASEGIIAFVTAPEPGACSIILFALALPPDLAELGPYIIEAKMSDIKFATELDSFC